MTPEELAQKHAEDACRTLSSLRYLTWPVMERVIMMAIKSAFNELES
jgi:hypothetical protein